MPSLLYRWVKNCTNCCHKARMTTPRFDPSNYRQRTNTGSIAAT